MALLYGKPTEYAIRALTYLATRPEQEIISVQEIAQVEDISSHHLSKVMNQLARGKMVQPLRGPGGGYKLIRHPEQITLWEVMGCLGARDVFEECAIGWADCSDKEPCPLHDKWLGLRVEIQTYLETVKISELASVAVHKANDPISISIRK